MAEAQTAVAEPSSAAVVIPPAMDVSVGPLANLSSDERAEFRKTGNLPEQPKKVETPAVSDAGKDPASEAESAESEGATDPPQTQEHHRRKPTAEQRIAQLTSEKKRLREELDTALAQKPAAEAKPEPKQAEPQQQPQNYQEWRKTFKAEEWTAKYAKDNPEASYEDMSAAMADYLGDARDHFRAVEANRQESAKELSKQIAEAKGRYENFDDVIEPTAGVIDDDPLIDGAVKHMLRDSDILPDLIYTIGSKPEELASFVKMARENPGKALRYIALTESLIHEELAGKATPAEPKEPPAKPETKAPRPPTEAGGRAAAPPDGLRAALEANDYRAASAEFKRQALAKLKG